MQFIKNGPDIPDRLLEAHEDGRVVFFCGAGISYSAGLPGFKGLVKRVYSGLGATPSPLESVAIRRGNFETAIGLLEQIYPGGRAAVRREIAGSLTPNLSRPSAMEMHEALLTLSKTRDGRYRLTTTNFDTLFEEVISRRGLTARSFAAPLLPVPKSYLDGIVYLHGRLQAGATSDDLNRLVISSGDFGLAYLNERWASRFVTELFRNFTVCFVGYSINDVVLRYMMDAIAADRMLGETSMEMFAFGSFGKGKEEQTANEWKAKNVTPILYREHNHHSRLRQTLSAWAGIYRDGVSGKESIIVQHAMAKPMASTKQDDFVGRVLWALADERALPAKRFAELDPAPSIDWLDPLTDTRFGHADLTRFGVQPSPAPDKGLTFSFLRRPAPYPLAPLMSLVGQGSMGVRWDPVMHHLARWLTRHIQEPKLILWVAKTGGLLHPDFSRLVGEAIASDTCPPLIRTIWLLVLSGRLDRRDTDAEFHEWRRAFHLMGPTATLRQQLRDLLRPRIRLSEPLRGLIPGDSSARPLRIRNIVEWEVVLGPTHPYSRFREVSRDSKWRDALPGMLSDATDLLRDTLDLGRELGDIDDRHDRSYFHRPSIAEHPQNREYRDWTLLIEIARDAWLATAQSEPSRALLEVERWISIPYPLFRRLVFFAATQTQLIPPQRALSLLLAEERWWLWATETMRESLRLLSTIAPLLNDEGKATLERAILLGPPIDAFRVGIEPERLRLRIDRDVWLRLAKYAATGTTLGNDAAARLQDLTSQYPEWKLAEDERDEFAFWMGGSGPPTTVSPAPRSYDDIVRWLQAHPQIDEWEEDGWRERCRSDFRATACALLRLARNGEWITGRWHQALYAWATEDLASRSYRWFAADLASAPDAIFRELHGPVAWWIEVVAKHSAIAGDMLLALIQRILLVCRSDAVETEDDPVGTAINHPVGHAAEAAILWWGRQGPRDGQGIPAALVPIFSDLCDLGISSFRHGRVILASHVVMIFRVDENWASRHLLPLFDWQRPDEAAAMWAGYLWSPRLYRPLMDALKIQFLATASHYAALGDCKEQYAGVLTLVALDMGSTFSRSELAAATRTLPGDGLQRAAEVLDQAMEGAGAQRLEYWRNRIQPYLKQVWPKSRDLICPAIAESLGRLCITAGDAFSDAWNELQYWLIQVQHPDFLVNSLYAAGLCAQFPEASLAFLTAIVGDTPEWPPSDLGKCLDAIRDAQPTLESDPRYKNFREYLRSRGTT